MHEVMVDTYILKSYNSIRKNYICGIIQLAELLLHSLNLHWYQNLHLHALPLSGTYIREFGQGQLSNPRGLTFTTEGNVVVASFGNKRVHFQPRWTAGAYT